MNRKIFFFFFLAALAMLAGAQKKPLDHSVYDSWESIAQVLVSNDGNYSVYTVAPQDGDSTLYVTNVKTQVTTRIDRGFNARITDDSRYLVFQIKPTQNEKKKRANRRKARMNNRKIRLDGFNWAHKT